MFVQMWCPLTPPQSDNDVYIDTSLGFLYESSIMSESELPPVYVKKELKRRSAPETLTNCDREGRRPLKVRLRDEPSSQAPRSLFDRPSPALIKIRRDMKLHKSRGIVRSPTPIVAVKPTAPLKPAAEQDHTVEWLIYEDHTLLKVSSFEWNALPVRGSCHRRQKPQAPTSHAPIRNRQKRKVANAKGLNRNTNSYLT